MSKYVTPFPSLRVNIKLGKGFTMDIAFRNGSFDTDVDLPEEMIATRGRDREFEKELTKAELKTAVEKVLDNMKTGPIPVIKIIEGKKIPKDLKPPVVDMTQGTVTSDNQSKKKK